MPRPIANPDPTRPNPFRATLDAARAALVLAVLWFVFASTDASAQDQRGDRFETPWVSEESPPAVCRRRGFAVHGISCRGRYCDDKLLICRRYSDGNDRIRYSWSRQFSEEGGGNARDDDGLVTGLACTGRYCDNISLQFARSATTRNLRGCYWRNEWYSEEGIVERNGRRGNADRDARSTSCENGEFVAGVRCRGSYCDDISLYCCRLGR